MTLVFILLSSVEPELVVYSETPPYRTSIVYGRLSATRGCPLLRGQEMYSIKGKVSWDVVACPLLREFIIRSFIVHNSFHLTCTFHYNYYVRIILLSSVLVNVCMFILFYHRDLFLSLHHYFTSAFSLRLSPLSLSTSSLSLRSVPPLSLD